jgi:hypothetical protein
MDYQFELGRHSQGFVLYARPRQFKHPWLGLKLMCPGPAVRRRGESRRIWLSWNLEQRKLGRGPGVDRLQGLPEIYDWVVAGLERYEGD